MAREFLCRSANGREVFFDTVDSHAVMHFDGKPELRGLVCEVLGGMELVKPEIASHFDLGRVIGTSDVVTVDEGDEIVYGVRRNCERDGLVPFVKGRNGESCRTVALHVVRQPDESYMLSSAWIGEFGGDDEPFPQAPDATERSIDYWDHHAFVYGSQEMIAGTETTQRPW